MFYKLPLTLHTFYGTRTYGHRWLFDEILNNCKLVWDQQRIYDSGRCSPGFPLFAWLQPVIGTNCILWGVCALYIEYFFGKRFLKVIRDTLYLMANALLPQKKSRKYWKLFMKVDSAAAWKGWPWVQFQNRTYTNYWDLLWSKAGLKRPNMSWNSLKLICGPFSYMLPLFLLRQPESPRAGGQSPLSVIASDQPLTSSGHNAPPSSVSTQLNWLVGKFEVEPAEMCAHHHQRQMVPTRCIVSQSPRVDVQPVCDAPTVPWQQLVHNMQRPPPPPHTHTHTFVSR